MTDTIADLHHEEEADWHGRITAELKAANDGHDDLDPAATADLRHQARALLGSLIRPHRARIALVLLIALLQVAAAMAGPLLVGLAIDHALPRAVDGSYGELGLLTALLVVAAVLSAGLRSLFVVLSGRVGQHVLFDLRRRLYDHTQALSVSWHERFTSGRVISRLTSDVDTLTELLDAGLDGLLIAGFNISAIAVILLVLDVPLALIALAALVPLWVLFRWFDRSSRAAFRATRGTVATMIVGIVESFNGIRAVQAFRRERRNDAIFARLNDAYRQANKRAFRMQAVFIPGTNLIGAVAQVVVLLVGGYRVASGGLDLGVLTAFLLYLRQFFDPMEDIGIFYNSLQSATAALEKIAAVLAEPPSVPEPAMPAPLPSPVRGALDLERVAFSYTAGRTVLHELDLHIPSGQTVALVGATGAGKTTIAKLISRFYDPSSGSVRLDGVDLASIADADLRRAIVMITQDGYLFSGSVADNIAFGRINGGPPGNGGVAAGGASRADVEAAAAAVGADGFIRLLPDGYDTDVRKRGGRLSAGQRQLIAFARAFLADPAVLILDEATSSLDVPTERAVQAALHTVLAGRTALIIAHRLSTVAIADRVLVLHDGRVVEDGTPDELLTTAGGRFAALHESWRDSLA